MDKFLGNTRFFFDKQTASSVDIASALSSVDEKIRNSMKLDFYTEEIILEFFIHPTDENFIGSQVNIGRYITGFDQSCFNELNYKDFTVANDKRVEIEFSDSWDAFFSRACKLVPGDQQKWKLILKDDFSSSCLIL